MLVSNARKFSIKTRSPKSNVLWNVSIGARFNSSEILWKEEFDILRYKAKRIYTSTFARIKIYLEISVFVLFF